MKFIIAILLFGCAHSTPTKIVSKKQTAYDKAWASVEQSLVEKIELYGKTIPCSRYMQLVDVEITDDGEAGVAVIEARGEEKEFVGRLFVYLFFRADGTCQAVLNITKVEVNNSCQANSQRL